MRCLERAVLMFEEDAAVPAGLKPLMLETVLSRPILSWVCDRLRAEGVQRLFAVCGPRFAELEAFLDTDEPVLVLPRAAFPMEQAGPGFAYAAPGRELREIWRVKMTNSVQGAELVSGWLPVYGPETVAEIEALLRPEKAPEGSR